MECLLTKKLLLQYDLKESKEKLIELIDEYIRVRYTFRNLCDMGDDYYTKIWLISFLMCHQ